MNSDCWMLFLNDICKQAVLNNIINLKSSGNQIRDFITITDVCRATYHISKKNFKKTNNTIFNLGGEMGITLFQLLETFNKEYYKLSGLYPKLIKSNSEKSINNSDLDYSIEKIKKTGFKLSTDIKFEIQNLIKFCIDNFKNK